MHASLKKIGAVEGGAAMVLYRLLSTLGKNGTLLMPTFTSVTRHSATHNRHTQVGCWCEGKESRHLPFIPELQPDLELGEIPHRLCSWPASTRSRHPAFSFVAVGMNSDNLVRGYSLTDPLQPLRLILKYDPLILTVGVGLDSVTAIHLAEQRRTAKKFLKERALTVASSGQAWVDVVAPGCSLGFEKLADRLQEKGIPQTQIGFATATLYPMKTLVATADRLLGDDPCFLSCGRPECLSCLAHLPKGSSTGGFSSTSHNSSAQIW
jgi:aminoglycoside 3-N-acetyltransferase